MTVEVKTIRKAEPDEAGLVRDIDNRVFPQGNPDLEPAKEGDLEEGVELGHVRVLEVDGRLVAYLHVDRRDPSDIYISGIGVLPELQGQGLGRALIELIELDLYEDRTELPIWTVTSPQNTRMLRMLFRSGFAGRRILLDHFGPGKHRVFCQALAHEDDLRGRTPARSVCAEDLTELHRLAAEGGWVMSDQFFDVETGRSMLTFVEEGEGDFIESPESLIANHT